MRDVAKSHIYERNQRVTENWSESANPKGSTTWLTIRELAEQAGVTLRALRFYQSKGLLSPGREGHTRVYRPSDRERLALILQGKRLGFTLSEIRDMLAAHARGGKTLPISRQKCVEQITLLERQRRELEVALAELRQIYTGMYKTLLGVMPEAG
jgi:DNA-binding transcriptional MerR regulator